MADEQSRPPFNPPSPGYGGTGKPSAVPKEFAWPSLLARDGDELEMHYRHVLESLGKQQGMLGVIFRKAQNKIQDPAKLRRLIVDLIDKEQWSSLSADVKGDAYEGLLQKNAEDVKGGAGQYFTPRPLIAAMVDAVAPQPGSGSDLPTICDPACGTGGFLLAAHDYIARIPGLDKAQKKRLKNGTLFGIELVDSVARLCCMDLLLHGIGPDDVGPMPSSGGKDTVSSGAGSGDPPHSRNHRAGNCRRFGGGSGTIQHHRRRPEVLSSQLVWQYIDQFPELVWQAKAKLDSQLRPDGFNVGVNIGQTAGQTVMRVRIHLIPCYLGDMDRPEGCVRGVTPEKRIYNKKKTPPVENSPSDAE